MSDQLIEATKDLSAALAAMIVLFLILRTVVAHVSDFVSHTNDQFKGR